MQKQKISTHNDIIIEAVQTAARGEKKLEKEMTIAPGITETALDG